MPTYRQHSEAQTVRFSEEESPGMSTTQNSIRQNAHSAAFAKIMDDPCIVESESESVSYEQEIPSRRGGRGSGLKNVSGVQVLVIHSSSFDYCSLLSIDWRDVH